MKKLQLKKVQLAEMPADSMLAVNGGIKEEVQFSSDPLIASILLSIYTVSIVASGCGHCASYGCQSRDCQATSKASHCLC